METLPQQPAHPVLLLCNDCFEHGSAVYCSLPQFDFLAVKGWGLSMKLERLYNNIAKTYNQKSSAHVLSESNNAAFGLISNSGLPLHAILSLGVGDGLSLLPYKHAYPEAHLYGLDVSEKMLEKAKARLACEVFHGDIAQASSIIKKNDFDLILAHFVTAYVPLHTTLEQCKRLLGSSGLVSIVTNTMQSFPIMQGVLNKLNRSPRIFNKLISHHIARALKTVYVPKDLNDLESTLIAQGFKIEALQLMEIKIKLEHAADVFEFFIEGSWCASGIVHPLIPSAFFNKIIRRLINEHLTFPFEDTMYVALGLGQVAS